MADYPGTVATFPTWVNGDDINASNQNDPNDEITAVESALLNGFAHNIKAPGFKYDAAASEVIATGIITIQQGYNIVDTEGAAATDNLDTVSIGAMSSGPAIGEGSIIVLQAASAARIVTARSGVGNLSLNSDFVFTTTAHRLTLMYYGSSWYELARSPTATTGSTGSIATATPTTIFSAVNPGRYDIYAYISGAGAANYTAFATAVSDDTNVRIVSNDGGALTITLSGTNIQVTQTSGGAAVVRWGFKRL